MSETDSVPLRGRQRQRFARQLAARYTHNPVPIGDLAAEVHRRPTLVRRLLEEAGIQVGGGTQGHRQGVAAELADRYAAGDSLETLAKDTGIDRRVVRGLLTDAGVTIRERRPLPAEQGQWVVDQYRGGTTLRELAEHTGCSYATVRRYLLQAGVDLRPPGGHR
jgi:DNA-directed RNA polymerase specialized sigma24 family protein